MAKRTISTARNGTAAVERKRNGIGLVATILGLALLGCDTAELPPTTGAASVDISRSLPADAVEVIRVRIVPYKNPAGNRLRTVLVDWKNIGTKPIRAVDANIILFDGRGRLDGGPKDYAIYAVSDDSPGIAPGEVYQEPADQGYILAGDLAKARRARVEITEVLETGAY